MGKTMTLAAINATVRSPGLQLLDSVLAETLKEDDLKQIVGTFVQKAKEGHVPSANFLLKMLGADSTPQNVVINNFESDSAPQVLESTGISRDRERSALEKVTVYLSASGESSPTAIAGQLHMDVDTVISVLDNNPARFAVNGAKYSLVKA